MKALLRNTEMQRTVMYEQMMVNDARSRGYDGVAPLLTNFNWTANISGFPAYNKTVFAHVRPPTGADPAVIFLDMNPVSPTYGKLLALARNLTYTQWFPEIFQYFGDFEAYINGGGFVNPDPQ